MLDELEVRHVRHGNGLDELEAVQVVDPVEEPLAAAEENGHLVNAHLVHQARVEILPADGSAAGERDVLGTRDTPRLLERLQDSFVRLWRRQNFPGAPMIPDVVGARVRVLPPIPERSSLTLSSYIDQLEQNVFSWTWSLDDDTRVGAARAVRAWASDRFGPLDEPRHIETEIRWRAYELP